MRKITLPFIASNNERIADIEIISDNDEDIIELSDEEAAEQKAEKYQIKEDGAYQYCLKTVASHPFQLKTNLIKSILKQFNVPNEYPCGIINPGSYTGRLKIEIIDSRDSNNKASVCLEVIPRKLDFRSEYRYMLDYIAEKCTDLLLHVTSPTQIQLDVDDNTDPRTLEQQLVFLLHLLDTNEFYNAINQILSSPHVILQEIEEKKDIRKVGKISKLGMKQLSRRYPRIKVPDSHPIHDLMRSYNVSNPSLPADLTVIRRMETRDTAENRFIKYILTSFQYFLDKVISKISDEIPNSGFIDETRLFFEKILNILHDDFFRELSAPTMIPLGSPVLQRKAGYREMLNYWLKFELSAMLSWEGGENVYGGGKRDLATLYEYWLFFQLFDLFSEMFAMNESDIKLLFEPKANGLGLKLKSGERLEFKGTYNIKGRKLNVRFYYNKTFRAERPINEEGSWTRAMRPDYTLTIWPADFGTQEKAEEFEIISHLHFDSKYKVKEYDEIFGEENIDNEKQAEREGIYKRGDLLKMHSYRDAIRRTEGAFVLYPGTKLKKWPAYHEILPGVGAFAVRPNKNGVANNLKELKEFIEKVICHLSNRASQSERLSYHRHLAVQPGGKPIYTDFPEKTINNERIIPPMEQRVAVCWYKNIKHKNWILKNGLYNIRLEGRGAVSVSSDIMKIDHLLLYGQDENGKGIALPGLFKIKDDRTEKNKSVQVMTKEMMQKRGYPVPRHGSYLVFSIEKDKIYDNCKWDYGKLEKFIENNIEGMKGRVFTTYASVLLEKSI